MPGDNLNNRLLNLTEVAFCANQDAENNFKVVWEHLKHNLIDFIQIEFWAVQQAKMILMCHSTTWNVNLSNSHNLQRFLDFTQVAFWAGKEEENEFPVPCDHLKNRFLDLTKLEFWVCQEAQNYF